MQHTMKRLLHVGFLGLLAALALASSGCKSRPKNITAIPGSEGRGGTSTDLTQGNPLPPTVGGGNNGGSSTVLPPSQGTRYNPNQGGTGIDLPPVTNPGPGPDADGNTALPLGNIRDGMREDTEMFRGNTVYFDYDKSAVKKSEVAKLAAVAEYLKANPSSKLEVAGHCDERGTEGYNLALGERRALSIRESLLNMGVSSANVTTVSFGEARPVDPAQSDAAYAKNRRGEFILLTPIGSNPVQ
jgi:peptidoglycan-associated lipoprotein